MSTFTESVVEDAALAWLESLGFKKFMEMIVPIDRKMSANDDETRLLGSLRDALLPKLISRQLPLKNTGRLVETA